MNINISNYRTGGFGGIQKMSEWLTKNKITHVIDSSHPFAKQISYNAYLACKFNKIPIVRLTRKPWKQGVKDNWINVSNYQKVFKYICKEKKNIFLAIGRKNINFFYSMNQNFYLIRTVEKINFIPKFTDYHCIVSKGPFNTKDDILLLKKFKIDLIISKNSGGIGAFSKIEAARILNLPIIMIQRPCLPQIKEFYDFDKTINWLNN